MRHQDLKEICKHRNHYIGPIEWSCALVNNHLESQCCEENCPFIDEVATGIYTAIEAHRYLRTSKSNIYEYAQKGILPGRKVGKQWRFHKKALDDWLMRKSSNFRIEETDVGFYVYGPKEGVSDYSECVSESPHIVLDFNRYNELVGIEILKW